MGEHVGWAEPNGLLPNGLLPNEGKVFCVLDSERWLKAEERTADLIACIQPNEPSEERRNAVADYVQRLIMKCFPCQVFTFGSVPLKTYLPDGDIDLTAFSNNQTLKDTWANLVSDMLKIEEKNDQAEFRVKEVQYIQAEVKIIKCLVENIVVDISFNQLGGLCTLCFLEEVDHLINHNHLFKRSIILIKAWCYYESRVLGAHHGLISTYALETLVLYIFHVFNNSFTGPLEVLYRFLEFFSKFDWDNFCVSLWGPVPVSSLPDVTAEPPRKDGGNLLLSKLFLDACSTVYAVFPSSPENQSQPILSKYFNVIDPLRVNNNLGRSVSKGNFYRIRSAFALGAKRLARLLDCPKENLIFEVNNFFKTTWERHGSGRRPDALETDNITKSDDFKSNKKGRKTNNAAQEKTCNHVGNVDEGQRSTKSDHLVNGINGRSMFARTNSSPDELSDMSTQVRRRRVLNSNNRKENGVPDGLNNHNGQSLIVDLSSVRMAPSHQGVAASVCGYHHHHDSGGCSDALIEEELGLNEEEQDLVNMMESSSLNHFNNGHVPSSYDLRSTHLPIIIPPSFLASLGYTQQNLVPDPCLQFPHGFFPQQPLAHRFPGGLGLSSNLEYSREQSNCENIGLVEAENDLWQEQEVTENCSLEMLQPGGSEPNKQVFMAKENSSGLVPLYLTIPPLPFLTMLPPVCETGCSDTAPEMLEDKDTWTEGGSFEHCNGIITTSTISCDEYNKCDDILNSDFGSHFQNMQFGRFCQNPPNPGPMMFYPNPVMIQPDGPGRPLLPTNFNLLTQLMATPRVVPVAPPPSLPNRPPPPPPNIYQRSGTGTYLPKAVSVRDYQPSSNPKRVNYHYDRNDSHGGDGEGNWKTRAGGGRIHNRNQAEKSISRLGRLSSAAATTTSESRADRSWGGSYRNVSISSFSRANIGGPPIPPGVAYGGATTTSSSSTTTSVPSVVMFYPFDHGEHLEFGSLGPIGGGGGAFDEQHISPDQPSSPRHPHRRF